MATKSLTIRIDDKLLDKLHVVADYEGRSANSQVLILIRNCVKEYEKENGEILPRRGVEKSPGGPPGDLKAAVHVRASWSLCADSARARTGPWTGYAASGRRQSCKPRRSIP